MSGYPKDKEILLDGIFDLVLPLLCLGPTIGLYALGVPLALLMTFVEGSSPFVWWMAFAGIGLVSCIRLALCQKREWLSSVGVSIWLGILIGYAVVLMPAMRRLIGRGSISWEGLLQPQVFFAGAGPALYVPIIMVWMALRERRDKRRRRVVTS